MSFDIVMGKRLVAISFLMLLFLVACGENGDKSVRVRKGYIYRKINQTIVAKGFLCEMSLRARNVWQSL